jgi:hypothetical protein
MQDMNEIAIWPGSNYFLRTGLKFIAQSCLDVDIRKGYIFVDFSAPNLRFFTNSEWINTLRTTSMRIVLICDSIMEPLAEYWRLREKRIYTAIYTDYNITKIVEMLTLSAFFSRMDATRRINRLDKKEVFHIDLSLQGLSPSEMSQVLNLPVKKIYNIKQGINRKLRKDIERIMFSQL